MQGDLMAAAQVLAAAAPEAQARLAETLLREADAAHRYFKRFGRPHCPWGAGSLMARANIQSPRSEANCADPRFLAALAVMARSIAAHKALKLRARAPYDSISANQGASHNGRNQSKTCRN